MAENIKDYFVIDASFTLSYFLPDEESALADKLFGKYACKEVYFMSTALFPFEVLNSLKVNILRRRISHDFGLNLAHQFLDYLIPIEEIDFLKTFEIAVEENLTVYDASYVALARKKKCQLLTLDQRLEKLAS